MQQQGPAAVARLPVHQVGDKHVLKPFKLLFIVTLSISMGARIRTTIYSLLKNVFEKAYVLAYLVKYHAVISPFCPKLTSP